MVSLIHLESRGLLGINGSDAADFLQGAITNDITKLMPNDALYAAHLTPQGKFLFDFLIYSHNNMFLLDCSKAQLMPLAQSLHKYAVGRAVEFHDMSDDFSVYAAPFGTVPNGAALVVDDPRHAQLPKRVIMPNGAAGIADGITKKAESEFETSRLELAIPDGNQDAISGKTLPAELGLDELNGVSFKKGCYVGQELTTRMKHRTTPKTRLFKVKLEGANTSISPQTVLRTVEKGLEAGHLMSNDGKTGLALLKLRILEKETELVGDGFSISAISAPEWLDFTWPPLAE
jgi:hypothetical protein